MNNNISNHPKWSKDQKQEYYIPKNATKLLIGSMPPARICANKFRANDLNFFYGSSDNHFWDILFLITNKPREKTIRACQKFLDDHQLGLFDVVKSCIHNANKFGNPLASDKSLLSITPIPQEEFLEVLKGIKKIYITGDFVLDLLKIFYAEKVEYNKKEGLIYFKGYEKPIHFKIISSPTRRNFAKFKEKILEEYTDLIEEI